MAQRREELSKTGGPLERRNVEEYQPQETAGWHNSVLQLQRRAGNRAVASLFEAGSFSSAAPRLQRAPANGASPAPETPSTEPTASGPLIVADDAATIGPGQMRKSEFLEQLRSAVCTTADQALAEVGQNTEGCPYIEQWLSYYSDQEPAHVERALRKYAPEANNAATAADYIPAVSNRVREGVQRWARTGEITGVPDELAGVLPTGGGALGMVGGALAGIGSAIGSAITGAASAVGNAFSSLSSALFKTKDGAAPVSNDPQAIQQQLSEGGQPLDSTVNAQMSAAFGHDFSNVRVHSNAQAAGLSAGLNARAFTIGSDIAFAGGEYQPGTLVGDALIAHELAHVVQQSTGAATVNSKNEQTPHTALEDEADVAAVSAVASIWGGTKSVASHALPQLKSGLKLQSCGPEPKPTNRYEELVVEGTKKLQDPPFTFGLPWEGIKCGEDVAGEKKPFDEEFWSSQWVDPVKKNECMLVNKKPPSAAIEALFDPARRNKWHIDCTIFTQLPHLYAQLRTFGPQEFNKRLSNRIELRKEFSTGLKSRVYWVEGSRRGVLAEAILDEGGHPVTEIVRGTNDLTSAKVKPDAVERPADDVLKEVPVGSRVTFATYPIPNLFAALKPVLDNTVKMADNYYAAHDVPAGKDGMYTKEEIQELLGTKYNRPKENVYVVLVEVREVP